MPISFELTKNSVLAKDHYNKIAREQKRPLSREADTGEHDLPEQWVDFWWNEGRGGAPGDPTEPGDGFVTVCIQAEELCWGDAGLYLRMPTAAAPMTSLRGSSPTWTVSCASTSPASSAAR